MIIESIIIIGLVTSLSSLIVLRPLAVRINLVDFPNERKNHYGDVPLIGGISIFLGLLLPYCFIIEFNKFSIVLLITSALVLIQGIWDDLFNLKAKTKMAFQVFLTATMIYLTDLKLNTFGHLFAFPYPLELGVLSVPITIISVVGLTNAINMIDGLDGLAASFVLLAIIGLLGFNLNTDIFSLTYILLAIAVALVPFMIFNITSYTKMKVFLGDGGSLFLGYIISWALIYYAENVNNFNPSYALWCVLIPLFDLFTVIIIRIFQRRPLMVANKDHIHHFLENLGFSKKLVLVSLVFLGFICLLIGNMIEDKFPNLSFPVFIALFLLYLFIRIYYVLENKIKDQ